MDFIILTYILISSVMLALIGLHWMEDIFKDKSTTMFKIICMTIFLPSTILAFLIHASEPAINNLVNRFDKEVDLNKFFGNK